MATPPNQYPLSPFFSFRWVNENPVIDSRYHTLPVDSLVDEGNYAQPWQTDDKGQIQYTNIFVPTCGLYTCDDVFVKEIPMLAINPPLVNTDLICYNGEVDFSDVDPGRYYAKLTYTDENSVIQDWRTSPLDVEDDHPGTLLYEASNDRNEKGAIFLNPNPIVINLRIHGMLRSPMPKSDAESEHDQYDNYEQLNSIPSETWTNLIGNSYGNVSNYFRIPWWAIQKINLLYSLHNVLIDGQGFAKISGSEFTAFRVDNQLNQDGYWAAEIQPNVSYPNEQYKTGETADGEYVVIYKSKTYKNVGADFAISGVFVDDTNLIKVILFNNGGDAFTLKLGTSAGGAEIRKFDVPSTEVKNVLMVEWPFTTNATLYLSGLNGTDCKIIVVYDDFLAVNTPPGPAVPQWQKNTVYWYIEPIIAGSPTFGTHFNVATGQGQAGTIYEGCVLAGTNGTLAITGAALQVWDKTKPLERQTFVGAPDNTATLVKANLPEEHLILAKDRKGGNSGIDVLSAATPPGPAGQNDYILGGSSQPFSTQDLAIKLPAFYYIGV